MYKILEYQVTNSITQATNSVSKLDTKTLIQSSIYLRSDDVCGNSLAVCIVVCHMY